MLFIISCRWNFGENEKSVILIFTFFYIQARLDIFGFIIVSEYYKRIIIIKINRDVEQRMIRCNFIVSAKQFHERIPFAPLTLLKRARNKFNVNCHTEISKIILNLEGLSKLFKISL